MRHRFPCLVAPLLALAAVALLLIWLGRAAPARAFMPGIRYVAPWGDDAGPCDGPGSPCRAIQRAIDVAGDEEWIYVAGGIYTSTAGTVAVITKTVSLRGGFGPGFVHDPGAYHTVLDARWAGSVVRVVSADVVFLEDLTLTHGNGDGNGIQTAGSGGGLYAFDTDVHVRRCVIVDNVGSMSASDTDGALGGGAYIGSMAGDLPAEVWQSQFISNTACPACYGQGGGLCVWGGSSAQRVIIAGNRFEGNAATRAPSPAVYGHGGAVFVGGVATLEHNLFLGNRGSAGGGPGYGGAICLWELTDGVLAANTFHDNVASVAGEGYGGAIDVRANAAFTMTNNLLADNDASTAGGGLCLHPFNSSYLVQASLFNNTLADNDRAAGSEGIWVGEYVTLTLTNNLIAGHSVGVTDPGGASSITAGHNLLWNDADPILGPGAIREDPRLGPGYRPHWGSPAIDHGLTIPWLVTDLEGTPRPQWSGYDIGAFEAPRLDHHLPLVLRG